MTPEIKIVETSIITQDPAVNNSSILRKISNQGFSKALILYSQQNVF
jgi:hypothetical protein